MAEPAPRPRNKGKYWRDYPQNRALRGQSILLFLFGRGCGRGLLLFDHGSFGCCCRRFFGHRFRAFMAGTGTKAGGQHQHDQIRDGDFFCIHSGNSFVIGLW